MNDSSKNVVNVENKEVRTKLNYSDVITSNRFKFKKDLVT